MWSDNLLINIFSVILAIALVIIVFFKRRYSHWKNLGVEYIKPKIPFGNVQNSIVLQKVSLGEDFADFYNYFKSKKVKHGGIYLFAQPILIPVDLDLVKRLMQIDFAHFTDHGGYMNEKDDPLSAHLFSLGGDRWRNLRVKLTPTFTSGKMKNMFPIMVKISQEYAKALERDYNTTGTIEAKDTAARFSTDIIASCAFGLDCNSLHNPDAEFRVHGKRLNEPTAFEFFAQFLTSSFPTIAKLLKMRQFPKEPTDFFWNVVKQATEYRQKNNIRRNDFLQLLLDMMEKDGIKTNDTLTFAEIAAQAFVFYLGGFETSSTVASFVMYELATNQDIQDKLREEIMEMLKENNGDLTYDAIMNLRYLDMVVSETLRKYPPLPALFRECTKDYKVPNTDIVIRKGSSVFIPVRGIHRDAEYYPDPEKFDPLRFSEENKNTRPQYAYIPFGEGPRICIGLRFGLLQTKIGLITVLRNYKIKLNPKTELPIKNDPKIFTSSIRGGLWVDLIKVA